MSEFQPPDSTAQPPDSVPPRGGGAQPRQTPTQPLTQPASMPLSFGGGEGSQAAPGTARPGAAPPMQPIAPDGGEVGPSAYRPMTWLVRFITLAAVLYAALSLAGVGSDYMQHGLLANAVDGMELTETQIMANDLRQAGIAMGQLGFILFISVLFLVWMYRSNKNARRLGAQGMAFSSGGCVGWWFVPLVNLVKPVQAVSETWKASDPHSQGHEWVMQPTSGLIGAWWAVWLVSNAVDRVALRFSLRAVDVNELMTATYVNAAANGLNVVAVMLMLFVVRGIHDRLERKHAGMLHGGTGGLGVRGGLPGMPPQRFMTG